MEPAEILLLGDRRLRTRSVEIADPRAPEVQRVLESLAVTLDAFRRTHGFGRAISAPQIGAPLRAIAVNLGKGTFFVLNPKIVWRSDESVTMWDDCMSFPDLLVRLARSESITIEYTDEEGRRQTWTKMDVAASELLQHEIDHLDGILAVDRAIDSNSLVLKSVFEREFEWFASQVDYTIARGLAR